MNKKQQELEQFAQDFYESHNWKGKNLLIPSLLQKAILLAAVRIVVRIIAVKLIIVTLVYAVKVMKT